MKKALAFFAEKEFQITVVVISGQINYYLKREIEPLELDGDQERLVLVPDIFMQKWT